MNASIETIISVFAKSNKTSKEKLMGLIAECEAIIQAEALATQKPNKENVGVRGRVASVETLELRQAIREKANELKEGFTIKELIVKLDKTEEDHLSLNNAVNYLATNENMFVKAGLAESVGKGRRQVIWKAV